MSLYRLKKAKRQFEKRYVVFTLHTIYMSLKVQSIFNYVI